MCTALSGCRHGQTFFIDTSGNCSDKDELQRRPRNAEEGHHQREVELKRPAGDSHHHRHQSESRLKLQSVRLPAESRHIIVSWLFQSTLTALLSSSPRRFSDVSVWAYWLQTFRTGTKNVPNVITHQANAPQANICNLNVYNVRVLGFT